MRVRARGLGFVSRVRSMALTYTLTMATRTMALTYTLTRATRTMALTYTLTMATRTMALKRCDSLLSVSTPRATLCRWPPTSEGPLLLRVLTVTLCSPSSAPPGLAAAAAAPPRLRAGGGNGGGGGR